MKKITRKHREAKARPHTQHTLVFVLLVAAMILSIYFTGIGSQSQTNQTVSGQYPNGTMSPQEISNLAGGGSYLETSKRIPKFNISNNPESFVSGEEQVFLSNGSNPVSVPSSISITTLHAQDVQSAKTEMLSILFGALPSGTTDGYIQNATNPLENFAANLSINGVYFTFYNIYLNTNSSGLPLYGNTSISPPVFQYETVFTYNATDTVNEVVSTSEKPLPNGSNTSLTIAEAIAKRITT